MTEYFYEKGKKDNSHALYFSKNFFDKFTFDYNSDSTKQYEPKNKEEAYKIQEKKNGLKSILWSKYLKIPEFSLVFFNSKKDKN